MMLKPSPRFQEYIFVRKKNTGFKNTESSLKICKFFTCGNPWRLLTTNFPETNTEGMTSLFSIVLTQSCLFKLQNLQCNWIIMFIMYQVISIFKRAIIFITYYDFITYDLSVISI